VLTEVLELVLAGADVSILAGTALLSLVSVVFTVSKGAAFVLTAAILLVEVVAG
jgi:hypothetical protein